LALTNKYQRIPLDSIIIERDSRQRREVEVDEEFLRTIKVRGVIQPIIVEKTSDGFLLIAGERRVAHSRAAGLPDIPARFASDLAPIERKLLEFEENAKRLDLPWKDRASAIWDIHHTHLELDAGWTQESTAESIGLSSGYVSTAIAVADALRAGDASIVEAGGIRAAYNILARKQERKQDDTMNDLLASVPVKPSPAHGVKSPGQVTATEARIAQPRLTHEETSILYSSFLEWAPAYSGQPFNLIHCDFPYGIGIDKSDQAKSANWDEQYDDSDEVFWELCRCLAENLDRLMSPFAHLFFWTSSDLRRQNEVLQFFQLHAPSLDFCPVPYIWHKTDNRGILPDPKRGGRRVYETALMASRGDRLVVKSVSNAYGAPTSKEIHQSEKPEPMLRHYFQMLVDEDTRLLDPTCGSGTALRAAESLGASYVLGLERNPGYVEGARIALRKFRLKRSAAK